jgi:phosphoenolpyruvate carboxykinase (GTP)
MLPFCGYNMGDYFAHWLEIGRATDTHKLPKLFWVNWFRRGEDGSFLWPGFGDNSRVVKWVVERVAGEGEAVDTPIGRVPAAGAIDTTGLDIDGDTMDQLAEVDPDSWRAELPQIEDHYRFIGATVPAELREQLEDLEKRLAAAD